MNQPLLLENCSKVASSPLSTFTGSESGFVLREYYYWFELLSRVLEFSPY